MQLCVGTSGWSYAPWKGRFYPKKLPNAQMLPYYAERFSSVEVNNTFYRLPEKEQLSKWAEQTPSQFSFAVKSPRLITHRKKLEGIEGQVREFVQAIDVFGRKLGP